MSYLSFLICMFATYVLGFLVALLGVQYSIHAAHRFAVLARPCERSSHVIPTPRLGGLGVAAAFYLCVLVMYRWWDVPPAPWLAAVIVGSGYAVVGGFLDDVQELSPRWKFLFQFAAAGTAVLFGVAPTQIRLTHGWVLTLSPWIAQILSFMFIVFMMNAYNFMDGMDGQAALFGSLVCLSMGLPILRLHVGGMPTQGLFLLILSGALVGLLVFNFPGCSQSNKTFMGDSGSQFVGFMLAVFALQIEQARTPYYSFVAVLIALTPFIWDVCFTLLRRLARGENILQAHRSHLYQRLLIAGWSHAQTLAYNLVFWFLCIFLAATYSRAQRVGAADVQDFVLAMTMLLITFYTLSVRFIEHLHRTQSPTQ